MKQKLLILCSLLLLTLASTPALARQAEPAPTPAPAPRASRATSAPVDQTRVTEAANSPRQARQDASQEVIRLTRRPRPIFRLGQEYTLPAGEITQDVVVVSGSARVDGQVRGDLVVLFGNLELGSTAVVDGNVVVVGGNASAISGAGVRGDMVVIGGRLTAPPDFQPGGEHLVIGSELLGQRIQGFLPWITSGLLLGRPVVPSLGWVWLVLAIVFFVSLLLSLLFEGAVRACAAALAAKPITTFFMGLLVLLLVGPVSVILAVSVIGIAVIPFLLCALLVAWTIGKVAVTRWLGSRVILESEPDNRAQAVRSFVVGFVILVVAYMVPVLGLATWLLVGVLGVGAATTTLFKALRRENPAPPPSAKVRAAPTAVPPAPVGQETPVPPVTAYAPASVGPTSPDAGAGQGWGHVATPTVGAALPLGSLASGPTARGEADLLALPRAGFWRRVAAGLLDFLIVMIVFQMLDIDRRQPLVFCLLMVIYLAGLWTWRGTTIGGIIAHMRVIRTDGVPLTGTDSLIRAVSSLFSAFVAGLGFLWILRDPERQAWHDKIAGTLVVSVQRSAPLR